MCSLLPTKMHSSQQIDLMKMLSYLLIQWTSLIINEIKTFPSYRVDNTCKFIWCLGICGYHNNAKAFEPFYEN